MTDNKLIYDICLADTFGAGTAKTKKILDKYSDAETFYKAGKPQWQLCDFLKPKDVENLNAYNFERAIKTLERCKKFGYHIITLNSSDYPYNLKQIINPPTLLYVKGDISFLSNKNELAISIVGSRNPTSEGLEIAQEFGYSLAMSNVVMVSGGAKGIDSSAEKGALLGGGKVISVLGCGINVGYTFGSFELKKQISQKGAVISEFPPDFEGANWTFPVRNRIISGLSSGTLVVEAGKKSGALITANFCLHQNRDLFAVPGSIKSNNSIGANLLLKECAKLTTNVQDILEEYTNKYKNLQYLNDSLTESISKFNMQKKPQEKDLSKVSEDAKKVYLSFEENSLGLDDLVTKTNLPTFKLLQTLTELELLDYIKCNPNKTYCKS